MATFITAVTSELEAVESTEARPGTARPRPARVGFNAQCPLCGAHILTISRGGRVTAEDLHPVPLHRDGHSGEGYMLCDECGVLAQLPGDLTLN